MRALYGLLLRTQLSWGRIAAVGAAGLVLVLLGVGAAVSGGLGTARELVNQGGLALLVPVTAIVFASSILGDPAEDGTLAYLWLQPVSRLRLALASLAAVATVALPFAVVPVVVAALLAGAGGRLLLATVCAASLAVLAYAAVFIPLGLRLRRALLFGLIYVAVWEGAVGNLSLRLARGSVRLYAQSLLVGIAGGRPVPFSVSAAVAVAVLLGLVVAGTGVAAWMLARMQLP